MEAEAEAASFKNLEAEAEAEAEGIYSYTSLERISRDQVISCLRVKMP